MKKQILSILLFSIITNQSAWATQSVKWVGTLVEKRGYHTPEHSSNHALELVRQDNNEEYDVIESESLLGVHIEKDKDLLVEIEGEVTPRFLFWGGDLIVKSFKILNELEAIPHHEPPKSQSSASEFRHLRSNF